MKGRERGGAPPSPPLHNATRPRGFRAGPNLVIS